MPSDAERIATSQRAQTAMADFLEPAFAVIEAAYVAKLTNLAAETPWETKRIAKLAAAVKILRNVRGQIEEVVLDGKLAADSQRIATQIERIPDSSRFFGVGDLLSGH